MGGGAEDEERKGIRRKGIGSRAGRGSGGMGIGGKVGRESGGRGLAMIGPSWAARAKRAAQAACERLKADSFFCELKKGLGSAQKFMSSSRHTVKTF